MRSLEEIRADIEDARSLMTPLQEELLERINYDANTRMDEHFKYGVTLEAIMSANWEDVTRSKYYEEARKVLRKLPGTYQCSYIPDADYQVSVQIRLERATPLDEQQGILTVLPYVKAVNGWKFVDIFEYTLSAYGCWALLINEDETRYCVCSRPHVGKEPRHPRFETDNIHAALEYIYKHHPYTWENGSTEPDDDEYGG